MRVTDWVLTAVFAALVLPCLLRLVRLDYAGLGHGVRHGDLAELLLAVAMVAMVSPVGSPIPVAGWQAVLVLTAGWFAVAWWRERGPGCAHHALSAVAMLYMLAAMPHDAMAAGPWANMSTMDSGYPGHPLGLPLIAVTAAVCFAVDAARAGMTLTRGPRPSGQTSRAACRIVMGAGMGYLLFAGAW